jgi:DNA polymerase-3 subunit epsilon
MVIVAATTTACMPLISHCRFTAIDFESAGATRGQTDSPVQVGLASWSPAAGHTQPFVSYLQTDQPILWSAQRVHGITPADLADAPPLLALWPELKSRLAGAIVVAHGKGTEKRFLRAFPGHGFGPWIDTLLLARAAWPELPTHSLGDLCRFHQLTACIQSLVPARGWHDALFDAVASLVLLAHIIETHALIDQPGETLLHPDTSSWHQRRR